MALAGEGVSDKERLCTRMDMKLLIITNVMGEMESTSLLEFTIYLTNTLRLVLVANELLMYKIWYIACSFK